MTHPPQTKRCGRCRHRKSVGEFYQANRTTGRLQPYCKICSRAAAAKARVNRDPTGKRYNLARYGLTLEAFLSMAEQQGGACAVCREAPAGKGHCSGLHVDHCHATGKVRGLLCSRCNTAIGLMRDDSGKLRSAAEYVERG